MSDLVVGCVPGHPADLARVRDALRGQGTACPVADLAAARSAIAAGRLDATLVTVEDRGFDATINALRALRQAFPTHAIVAWCDPRALGARRLLQITDAGISELVLRDVDDLRTGFAHLLAGVLQRARADAVRARFLDELPGAVRGLFRFGLDHAHEALDVDGVAAALGVTRRTLAYRLAAEGCPPPRVFLTWCRVLVAAELLDDPRQTLVAVAGRMDFPNGHALATLLRRYLGLGITALRARGVSATAAAAFRAALGPGRAAGARDAPADAPAGPIHDSDALVAWVDSLPGSSSLR